MQFLNSNSIAENRAYEREPVAGHIIDESDAFTPVEQDSCSPARFFSRAIPRRVLTETNRKTSGRGGGKKGGGVWPIVVKKPKQGINVDVSPFFAYLDGSANINGPRGSARASRGDCCATFSSNGLRAGFFRAT